jgi:hypothetical protein
LLTVASGCRIPHLEQWDRVHFHLRSVLQFAVPCGPLLW